MSKTVNCPKCGEAVQTYRNPVPTVDVVVFIPGRGVVLVERSNPPLGWALPGGFVDYGESCETAAVREAREETGLEVALTGILGVYSQPDRDPRRHAMSVVYTAQAVDASRLAAGSDAAGVAVFDHESLPELAFDHGKILSDFFHHLVALNPKSG